MAKIHRRKGREAGKVTELLTKEKVISEAKKVWNCRNFNRQTKTCKLDHLLCTGVYECWNYKMRTEREGFGPAPESWIKRAFEIQFGEELQK
jgi:hypothetical protein